MRYLLDSNTISELYDTDASHHSAILGHLGALTDRDQVCISVLSLYELEYGWANAPDEKQPAVRQVIAAAQSDFEALPLSVQGAVPRRKNASPHNTVATPPKSVAHLIFSAELKNLPAQNDDLC